MKLIVTDLGPIDRHPSGTDVTGLYDDETAQRLIDAGYLAGESKKSSQPARKKASKLDVN